MPRWQRQSDKDEWWALKSRPDWLRATHVRELGQKCSVHERLDLGSIDFVFIRSSLIMRRAQNRYLSLSSCMRFSSAALARCGSKLGTRLCCMPNGYISVQRSVLGFSRSDRLSSLVGTGDPDDTKDEEQLDEEAEFDVSDHHSL